MCWSKKEYLMKSNQQHHMPQLYLFAMVISTSVLVVGASDSTSTSYDVFPVTRLEDEELAIITPRPIKISLMTDSR